MEEVQDRVLIFLAILAFYSFKSYAKWVKLDMKIDDLAVLKNRVLIKDPEENEIIENYKTIAELLPISET